MARGASTSCDAPVVPARRARRPGRGGARAGGVGDAVGLPRAGQASRCRSPSTPRPRPARSIAPAGGGCTRHGRRRCGSGSSVPIPQTAPRRRCASLRPRAWTSSTSGSAAARPARATGRRPPATPLETLGAGSLDGGLFTGAVGDWVEVGLRCETADPRCDMADAAGGPALRRADRARRCRADVHHRRRVRASPPARSRRWSTPATSGSGVAGVTATLGGRTVATAASGQGRCVELSPADATADLPLAEDCPASDRLILSIDSTAVADGLQRLELLVADGAGNTTAKGFDVRVANTPPTPVPTVPPVPPPGRDRDRPAAAPADRPRAQARQPLQGRAATACSRSARAARPRRRRRARSR